MVVAVRNALAGCFVPSVLANAPLDKPIAKAFVETLTVIAIIAVVVAGHVLRDNSASVVFVRSLVPLDKSCAQALV